jgi:carboxyl-terminal processing protease
MENQNNSRKGNLPLPLIWVVSTFVICVVFVLVSIPRVQAQSRQQVVTGGQHISIIRNVFDFILQNYIEEVDPNDLFEGAMNGMFDALGDPYSSFLPASEMTDLGDTTQGSFGGVGLYITPKPASRSDGRPNFLEVAAPIENTPGWRAGINPGDLIVRINDEPTDVLSSDEAVARLRGAPGTEVRILIRRGEMIEFPVTLMREVIEVPTTKYAMIDDIGYLKLLTFTPYTTDRARDAIIEFRAKGYRSLILDLRNNYGGLLNSAVGVTNLFIEGGVVVSTKSRIPQENSVFYARARALVSDDIPMVVLINRGSASASEIVAGALKDRGRAYLVGEKSFGKGSVQQVYPLSNVGFKLTTARYFTPSDANIDKVGIPPDREVLFPEFTNAEAVKLNELINAGRISDFVNANQNPSSGQLDTFVLELNRQYGLDPSLLKRLIRNELNRTTIGPVYDLEYDVQLQEAVRILREGNFRSLMRNAKTLKTLQEEALLDEDFLLAS